MPTEKNYPNGMLKADYVFEMYKELDPADQMKLRDMIRIDLEDQYRQANYTVNNCAKL